MRTTQIVLPVAAAAGAFFVASTPATGGGGGGNQPPVCTIGGLISVECNNQGQSVHVLDVGAFDPDGDPLSFNWSLGQSCAAQGSLDNSTIENPTLTFDMQGLCLDECGGITVTVSDNINPPVVCDLALLIQDTTPPSLNGCPADLPTMLWQGGPNGGPNDPSVDPANTGFPTGSDNCTNASPTMTEVVTLFPDPHNPQGLEAEIVRTWEIQDCDGSVTSCSQTITLVGPSFFNVTSSMDIDLGNNPSYLKVPPTKSFNGFQALSKSNAAIEVLVHGSDAYSVSQIIARDLKLERGDGNGKPVSPIGVFVGDFGTPGTDGLNHTTAADGHVDLLFKFSAQAVAKRFDLYDVADGSALQVHLTGTQWDGTTFLSKDVVLIQQ